MAYLSLTDQEMEHIRIATLRWLEREKKQPADIESRITQGRVSLWKFLAGERMTTPIAIEIADALHIPHRCPYCGSLPK